jgi:hypothetical protein
MEEEQEQELEQVTVKQVAIKWGLYLGMAFIVFFMITLLADLVGNQTLSYLNYVLMAVFAYMAQKSFKDDGNGFMSYKQGLGIGTLMTVVASGISVIFSYIYVKFLDDSMIQIIIDKQYEEMASNGMSDGDIERTMSMTESFMTPEVMFPLAFVFSVFFGFIISLIVSAITKNPDPSQEI